MYVRFKDLGCPIEIELVIIENEMLTFGYYSVAERKRYILQSLINTSEALTIGAAPYGGVAIWITDNRLKMRHQWLKADALLNQKEVTNSVNIPPYSFFDNQMKQFIYRYLVFFDKWDNSKKVWQKYSGDEAGPIFDFIEEYLFDGTHDKLHDGSLMKYHEAGKPKKLRIQWHIGKSEHSAYFWFEDERIRDVFDKFYGAHPDTKTDFIIRIDAEQRKYELALYRYGLKEPQIIPEDVYQLLVFKNKFEDYRSANYNQERGAWIW